MGRLRRAARLFVWYLETTFLEQLSVLLFTLTAVSGIAVCAAVLISGGVGGWFFLPAAFGLLLVLTLFIGEQVWLRRLTKGPSDRK